ncbi:MAG: polysaccharide biosynthesis/export family protein, partial [Verrucomicrobiales bacterium]|nr:polysaccharide biosynthesis/export family protein [Verrucomicrobiales bacterium]
MVTRPAPGVSWTEEYTVGAGDIFNIELYGKPETRRLSIPIQPDGTITFMQAQNINVQGMTIEGMRAELQKTLSTFYKNSEVIVQPVTLSSKRYFVLGRVVQKGSFVLDHPITIVEAVAAAKGFETSLLDPNTAGIADLSRSFIVRNGEKLDVNLEKLFLEGDFTQNRNIEPNDYLFFPSAENKEVYVLGAVNRPGKVDYLPGISTMSAIASAAGFNIEAFRDNVL